MTVQVNPQSELNMLFDAALRGEEVTLTRDGEDVVKLVVVSPTPKRNQIRLGIFPKEISDDLLAPTDQEVVDLFYSKD